MSLRLSLVVSAVALTTTAARADQLNGGKGKMELRLPP